MGMNVKPSFVFLAFLLFFSLSFAATGTITNLASSASGTFGVGSAQTVLRENNGTWVVLWIDSSGYYMLNHTTNPDSGIWTSVNVSTRLSMIAVSTVGSVNARSIVATSDNTLYLLLATPNLNMIRIVNTTDFINYGSVNMFTPPSLPTIGTRRRAGFGIDKNDTIWIYEVTAYSSKLYKILKGSTTLTTVSSPFMNGANTEGKFAFATDTRFSVVSSNSSSVNETNTTGTTWGYGLTLSGKVGDACYTWNSSSSSYTLHAVSAGTNLYYKAAGRAEQNFGAVTINDETSLVTMACEGNTVILAFANSTPSTGGTNANISVWTSGDAGYTWNTNAWQTNDSALLNYSGIAISGRSGLPSGNNVSTNFTLFYATTNVTSTTGQLNYTYLQTNTSPTPPSNTLYITADSPVNGSVLTTSSVSPTCSWISTSSPLNVSIYLNTTGYSFYNKVTGLTSNGTYIWNLTGLASGNYNWSCNITNATVGNSSGIANFQIQAVANFSGNLTYNNTVWEGNQTMFIVNFTKLYSTINVTGACLKWNASTQCQYAWNNNTNAEVIWFFNVTKIGFTDVQNVSFNFSVNFTNGVITTIVNTSNFTQLVRSMYVTNTTQSVACPAAYNLSATWNFYNSETGALVTDVNISMLVNYSNYDAPWQSGVITYNFKDIRNISLCKYPKNYTIPIYVANLVVTSYAYSTTTLTYDINLTATWTNYSVYLTSSSASKLAKVQVNDANGLPAFNVSITSELLALANSSYVFVDSFSTDENGVGITYVYPNDYYYRFNATYKGETTRFVPRKIFCDPLQAYCLITLNLESNITQNTTFQNGTWRQAFGSVNYSFGPDSGTYYDNITITLNITSVNGSSVNSTFWIIKYPSNHSGTENHSENDYAVTTAYAFTTNGTGVYVVNYCFSLPNFPDYCSSGRYNIATRQGLASIQSLLETGTLIGGFAYYCVALLCAGLVMGFFSRYIGDGAGILGILTLWFFTALAPGLVVVQLGAVPLYVWTMTTIATIFGVAGLVLKQYF